jgi:hypothetical protein
VILRVASSALLALALASCGDDEAQRWDREQFGVNGQLLLQEETKTPGSPLVDRSLTEIANLGAGFVRANLIWPEIEPTPPPFGGPRSYDFRGLDAWVGALARHGLRWQALIMGIPTPAWAGLPPETGCGFRSAPSGTEDFAALAAAIAERYGTGGSFWGENPDLDYLPVTHFELWNEENHGAFWCPAPDPEGYADLAIAAGERVRAADPSAKLILGALANFHETTPLETGAPKTAADEFVERMVNRQPDLPELIDVVAVHPYAQEPQLVLQEIAWFRSILDDAGFVETPMTVNEFGWDTKGSLPGYLEPVSEETRADYVAEVVAAATSSDCGLVALAPHTWTSPEQNEEDPAEWFGIADPKTGKPYETAERYGEEIRAADAASDDELTPCEELGG